MIAIKEAGINDIPLVQQIAYITWPATYANIVGEDQLIYMLQLIYSTEALTEQNAARAAQFYNSLRKPCCHCICRL